MASVATYTNQKEFYREFLMARQQINPRLYGVDLDKEDFLDEIWDDFKEAFDDLSVDELLLRPREALRICDEIRKKHQWFDLPDDIVLRGLLYRRKHPKE